MQFFSPVTCKGTLIIQVYRLSKISIFLASRPFRMLVMYVPRTLMMRQSNFPRVLRKTFSPGKQTVWMDVADTITGNLSARSSSIPE